MATRRKYGPRKFKDGGAVDIVIEEPPIASADATPHSAQAPLARSPTPPRPDLPPSDPSGLDAVRRAAEAARQADEYQKLMRNIDQVPGLSPHKKSFIRQNPMVLHPDIFPLAERAWREGVASGIADDSEQLNQHVLQSISRGMAQRQAPPMPARPVPPPPELPAADRDEAERLQAEADTYLAAMKGAMPAPVPAPNLPPIASPRRSLPVSAPVSRDPPMPSGGRTSQATTITLSPEEREIAHKSYGWMRKADAEQEYALQKAKLNRMRASGIYPERERN